MGREKLVVWHKRLELFSDVCAWFCVHVNVPMRESTWRSYAGAKVYIFQVPRLFATTLLLSVFTQDPEEYIYFKYVGLLQVHEPKTSKLSFIGQHIAKTWHSVIASLLRSLSHFVENAQPLVVPDYQSFFRFMNLVYLWTTTWEPVLLWLSTPWDTVVAANLSEKSRFFLSIFLNFLLIYCIIIWSVVMRVSSWVCTTPLPNFSAIGWELGEIEAISCTKQNKGRTLYLEQVDKMLWEINL